MNNVLYYTPKDGAPARRPATAELPGPVAVAWNAPESHVPGAEEVVSLREVTDMLHVGLIVSRIPSGELLMMNKAGSQLLGKELEPGMNLAQATDFFRIVREDGSRYPSEEAWASALNAGGSLVLTDAFVQRPNGRKVPLRLSTSRVVLANGKSRLMLCAIEDRSQEYRLLKAQEEFVAVASHQLRTPATGTKAFLSMLLDGDAGALTEAQKDFADRAYRSNERALRLVESLLQMAKIEAGEFILEREETDVRAVLKDAVEEHEATMEDAHAQPIDLVLPERSVIARIDAGKVRMLLDNLLDNARKYSPAGSSIEVYLAETSRHVIVSIADHGSGIPTEQQGKLFRRFGRVNQETAPDVPGTGLGLYFVQQIVGLHGGDVRIASIPGQGTLVVVKLPKKRRSE
jgi:signal transduction histidine kinase